MFEQIIDIYPRGKYRVKINNQEIFTNGKFCLKASHKLYEIKIYGPSYLFGAFYAKKDTPRIFNLTKYKYFYLRDRHYNMPLSGKIRLINSAR